MLTLALAGQHAYMILFYDVRAAIASYLITPALVRSHAHMFLFLLPSVVVPGFVLDRVWMEASSSAFRSPFEQSQRFASIALQS